MRYPYQNRGSNLIRWSDGAPPYQTRAGETRSLGDNTDTEIPLPGAPEYVLSDTPPVDPMSPMAIIGNPIAMIGGVAATFHGYKRTKSIPWTIVWGLLGTMSPIITNVVAVAQGFGKPKAK